MCLPWLLELVLVQQRTHMEARILTAECHATRTTTVTDMTTSTLAASRTMEMMEFKSLLGHGTANSDLRLLELELRLEVQV